MKLSLPCIGLAAALLLALPATAGTVQFDYQGCAQPVTLTIDDANSVTVWRQLASEAGFAVRAGPDALDTKVNFSMSGPLHEVLAALARYTGAVLVASNVDACLGSRQPRVVWLMSEGATSALMSVEQDASAPIQPVVGAPPPDAHQNISPRSGVQINSPRRRGQMTAAEREAERDRRRQARQARRDGRDDR